ncbi:MAG: 3-dehydroquinate synthase [Treponema sp.]|nr:3-dehydroquinate synthase [Treponema sp.]
MSIVKVNLNENSYDVLIEKGCFERAEKELNLNRKVLIVSDDGVPKEYAERLLKKCKYGIKAVFKQGEAHKTLCTMQKLFSLMLKNNFTRKDCVIALGGGVTGDLAGFTASCYMRGIDFYNIPTTVLSCVDSSVGGKTAVNFDNVKNIIGAFWQPKKVLIDVNLLKTLPARQISNGLAEALKMALTFDRELFELFKTSDPVEQLEIIILRSVELKARVVEQDEKEAGLRKVLNFGHTIGHGLELSSGGKLYHGECVALGMLCMTGKEIRNELITVLNKLKLPVSCKFNEEKVCSAVMHDKKSSGDVISTVFVKHPGEYEMKDSTLEQLKERLKIIKK